MTQRHADAHANGPEEGSADRYARKVVVNHRRHMSSEYRLVAYDPSDEEGNWATIDTWTTGDDRPMPEWMEGEI